MSKKATLIYPCHNRIEYTKMTLPMVVQEIRKDSDLVEKLIIFDDVSDDGTSEYVQDLVERNPSLPIEYIRKKIGNSTYQINHTYKNTDSKYLIKVDNDILIPFDYVKTLVWLMEKHNDIGFLMMPEVSCFPFIKPKEELSITDRSFIGGVGIFRKIIFDSQGDISSNKRYFGFTDYQTKAMQKLGLRACQLDGSGNMNLDASRVYSRVFEHDSKDYGRNLWKGIDSISDFNFKK